MRTGTGGRARGVPARIGCILAVLALAAASPARAQAAAPDAGTLLFEEPQLKGVAPGTTLTYAYSRKATDPDRYGPSFDDTIRLAVDKGANADSRTIAVTMFTGEHRRPAGPFEDMTGNPALSLFLENHLQELANRLHANPRYIKNAIRAALRDKAVVEKTSVEVDGRRLDAWHVRIVPFTDDPNRARMNGLDTLVYDFTVAADLPGEIVRLAATAPGPDGKLLIDESLSYDAKAP